MTKAEWLEWKANPLTKAFFRALRQVPHNYMREWAEGGYLSHDPQSTQNHMQRVQGELDSINRIANADYDEFKTWHHQDKENQDE